MGERRKPADDRQVSCLRCGKKFWMLKQTIQTMDSTYAIAFECFLCAIESIRSHMDELRSQLGHVSAAYRRSLRS